MNFFVREHSQQMRARQDAQWAVLARRIVQVDSQRHHLFERACRSVGIVHAVFHRPRSPPRDFPPLLQRQCRVLVPHDQPVRRRGLVKKRCAKRKCSLTQNLLHNSHQPRSQRHLGHCRNPHRMPHSSPTPGKIRAAQFLCQSVNLLLPQHFGKHRISPFSCQLCRAQFRSSMCQLHVNAHPISGLRRRRKRAFEQCFAGAGTQLGRGVQQDFFHCAVFVHPHQNPETL